VIARASEGPAPVTPPDGGRGRLGHDLMAILAGEGLGAGLNVIALVLVAGHLSLGGLGRYAYLVAFVDVLRLVGNAGI